MLRYLLLGLSLTPLIAQAEIACLEGPQGGNCHRVDVNGEIFKSSAPAAASVITPKVVTNQAVTNTPKQRRINTRIPASTNNQVVNNKARNHTPRRRISMNEQRIRQRAQAVEARFMHHQGINSLSQLDNTNDSYIKRKQQSAELRRRIETQR